jgi:hypothetical protein
MIIDSGSEEIQFAWAAPNEVNPTQAEILVDDRVFTRLGSKEDSCRHGRGSCAVMAVTVVNDVVPAIPEA